MCSDCVAVIQMSSAHPLIFKKKMQTAESPKHIIAAALIFMYFFHSATNNLENIGFQMRNEKRIGQNEKNKLHACVPY